jgi:hypothetical protein
MVPVLTTTKMMKKLLLLTLPLLLTLNGCKKKENNTDPFVSAKAGLYTFYSSGKMVTSSKTAGGSYNSVDIEGLMPSGATIKLWIKAFSGRLDTLQMDSTDASASYLPPTPSVEVTAVHGTLIFTSAEPMISGDFSFVCTDSTLVTGKFSIKPL